MFLLHDTQLAFSEDLDSARDLREDLAAARDTREDFLTHDDEREDLPTANGGLLAAALDDRKGVGSDH